ncbi:hypothetical protein [Rhizobium nepotum]|uniref:hypothetical protein n=1 Tax=Rhizobium nepotum TaxID=1035271 RepID=UPI003CF64FBD
MSACAASCAANSRIFRQRFGLTIILVTHDQLDAFTLSDRVALFRNGHVDQIGSPQELYEQPASDYARRFIGRSSALLADLSHAPDGSLVARLKGGQEILFRAPLIRRHRPVLPSISGYARKTSCSIPRKRRVRFSVMSANPPSSATV